MVLLYVIDLSCLAIGCEQVSFVRQLQLSEGSSCWSSVHPHLQTQEDMEGGVFKEKKVSATLFMSSSSEV